MNEVTDITVQYVNQPKPGKKWGSIKTATGEYYSGPPALVNEFKQGEACKVEWKPFGESGKEIVKKIGGVVNGLPPKQLTRPTTSKSDSLQIYVTAHTKNSVAQFIDTDGSLNEPAFENLTRALMRVFGNTLGAANSQQRNDLNDEIPY